MKNLVFLICILTLTSNCTFSQCTPNTALTDPTGYGMIIPSVINGNENSSINESLTIIPPTHVYISGGGTVQTHHIVLKSITNKPSWLSYACNPSSCTFYPGTNSCFLFTGTPPTGSNGVYDLNILWDVYTVIIGTPVLVASNIIIDSLKIKINISNGIPFPLVTSPITYCKGQIAPQLTAQGQNLLWYNSAIGGSGNNIAPTPNTSSSGIYNFWVSQTVGGIESGRSLITVNVADITANAGIDQNLICGDSIQLNVSSNFNNPSFNYSWTPTSGLNNPYIKNPKAAPNNTRQYKVIIYSNIGCGNPKDSLMAFVEPVIIDATGGQAINCGDSVQLGVAQNFSGSNYTYSWSPALGLNNPNIKTPKASPMVNIMYKVLVNTNNGCGNAKDSTNISLTVMSSTEICLVSVVNNKNKIIWDKLVETAIDSFYIYRETEVTNVYQKIGATSYNDSCLFVDNASNADIQSNKYRISIKDKCLLESPKSSAHKTMHLTINQGMGTTWNLIWEPYEGFTVSTYRIYRGTSPSNLTLIGTTSGSSTQYTDNTAPGGYVYYQLEVVSPNQCNPSKSVNKSVSNIATNDPITGLTTQVNLENINFYPNPVTDKLFINAPVISVQVYNSIGSIVTDKFRLSNGGSVIDFSGLATGIYYCLIVTTNGAITKKVMKE